MTPDSQSPPSGRWRLAQLWLPLTCTALLLVVATVVGGVVDGVPAAAGAFAGVGVVMASYALTMLVVAWADSMKTSWVLPLGMLTYVVKFTVIGAVLASVAATGWRGLPAMGFGVMAGIVTWIPAQIVALNRYNRKLAASPAEVGMPTAAKQE